MTDVPNNPFGEPTGPGGTGGQPPQGAPGQYPPPQQGQPGQFPPPQQAGGQYPPPQQGQPGQPQSWQNAPAYGAPPVAPKKSKTKPILLGCGGVLLLGVLGIGGCAFLFKDTIGGVVDLGKATVEAEQFLQQLDSESYIAARNQVTDDQGCQAPDQLSTAEATGLGASMSGYTIEASSDELTGDELKDVDDATFIGTTNLDGSTAAVVVEMVKDDAGDWRVCSFTVG